MSATRFLLAEAQLPTPGYNIQADLPTPCPPPLHPMTKEICTPADLAPLFAEELLKPEVSQERWIDLSAYKSYLAKAMKDVPLNEAKLQEALQNLPEVKIKL